MGVTGSQEMFVPPWYLISFWQFQAKFCPAMEIPKNAII
jgi:hypothetical protein